MRIGVILLIFSLFLVQFRQSIVEFDYALNKDYIKKVLCIEKDIPSSTCNGKCHLKKQLDKIENSSDSENNRPFRIVVEDLHFITEPIKSNQALELCTEKNKYGIDVAYNVKRGFLTIFIPPPESV